MANDKLKHEDILDWFEEIEKNEAAANFREQVNNSNAVGANNITTPHLTMPYIPFPVAEGTSHANANEMAEKQLTGHNLMTDLTPFSNFEFSTFEDGRVNGKGPSLPNTSSNFFCWEGNSYFGQYDTLGYSPPANTVVNSSSEVSEHQTAYGVGSSTAFNSMQQDGELYNNSSRPQLIRNLIGDGVSTPMSFPRLDDVESAVNNSFLVSGVRKDHPEKLDGKCLTLGLGHIEKSLSESNIAGNIAFNSEIDVLPPSDTFHSQIAHEHSSHVCPDVLANFSCVPNNILHFDKQQEFFVLGNRSDCIGVERNWAERSVYFDPNNSFKGYSDVCVTPVDNNLARFPDSFMDIAAVVNTRSTSLHNQLGKPFTANEGHAAQVGESFRFTENFRLSQLASNESPATKVNMDLQPSGGFVGASVKRDVAETTTSSSQAQLPSSGEEATASKVQVLKNFHETYVKRHAEDTFPATSQVQPPSSGEEATASKVQVLKNFHETYVKRRAEDTFPATSQGQPSKARRIQSSTCSTADSQLLDFSSPQSLLCFSSSDCTSPSLLLQAKNTSIQSQSWTGSAFVPQVIGHPPLTWTAPSFPPHQTALSLPHQVRCSSLPYISQTGHSIQPQTGSVPLLQPVTSSIPTKIRRNVVFPPSESQISYNLTPQAKSTTSLSLPVLTAPSLSPIGNSVLPPTLGQNAPSPSRHSPFSSPFQLQQAIGEAVPPKSLPSLHVSQKSHIALPLPSKSLTAKRKATHPVPRQVNVPPPLRQQPSNSLEHIKCKVTDQTELIGHKCLICKRDLAFTPEGPVSVPPIAPMVAVLPCGHTFHDHCLQLITPGEEVKSPPCIPCALGES